MTTATTAVTIVGDADRSSTLSLIEAIAGASPLVRFPQTAVVLGRGFSAEEPKRSWSEALAGLAQSSLAIVPADEPRIAALAGVSGARVVSIGYDEGADVRIVDVQLTSKGSSFGLKVAGERYDVALALIGEHFITYAAAALGTAWAVGIPPQDAIAALAPVTGVGEARMQPLPAGEGVLLIDDSASASSVSTVAALKALAMLGSEGLRTIAVLGPLDLPEDAGGAGFSGDEAASREAHDRIGRIAVRLNIRLLIVIGHEARHVHNAAGLEGSWNGESVLVESAEDALTLLQEQVQGGDAVLVKWKSAEAPSLAQRLSSLRLERAS